MMVARQVKVGHGGEKSLRAPVKKESLEGAAQRSGQEECEIQHQYSPIRRSS